jgi:hypothetical protein
VPDSAAGPDADAATTPAAFVRLAHWSPDAPGIDVCLTLAGATWDGQTPRIAQRGGAAGTDGSADAGGGIDAAPGTTVDAGIQGGSDAGPDGGTGGIPSGLAFSQATTYLTVAPDRYSVRLVAAGAVDCGTPLASLDTVTLADGTYTTLADVGVAAVGQATPVMSDAALKVVAFADDVTAPAGQIALRFINASPSASLASVAFGTGSLAGTNGPYASLFSAVPFAGTSSASTTDAGAVDANGYLLALPLAGATLSAHASALSDLVTASDDVTIPPASAATLALLGTTKSPELVLCMDAPGPPATLLANCAVVGP